MKTCRGWVAILLLCLGGSTAAEPLFAQGAESLVFTAFGMDAGLSQGTVEALLQDEVGFLWVGTHDGLNRFDGQRFIPFRNARGDSTTLSDDFVRSLVQTHDGVLWVGTDRGGINRLDPRTGEVRRFTLPELGPWQVATSPADEDPAPGRTVWSLTVLPSGRLLLSTDAGAAVFDPETGKASLEEPEQIVALCGRGADVVAGFADGSIRRRTPTGWSHLTVERAGISALECEDGQVLVGTRLGAVHAIHDDGRTEHVVDLATSPRSLPIEDIIRVPDGSLWLATQAGAMVVSPSGAVERVRAGGTRGLPHDYAKRFLLDRDGVLWVGTWNGLASLHPLSTRMSRLLHQPEDPEGLRGTGVVPITEGPDGDLWVGTLGGGIERVRLQSNGVPTVLTGARSDFQPVQDASVFDLAWRGDELWIAAHAAGFHRWTASGLESVPVVVDGAVVEATALSVLVDRGRTIWAGSREHGLLRFEEEGGRLVPLRGDEWNLGSRWIWPMVEAPDGLLWIGAYNGGVSEVDPAIGVLRRYSVGDEGLSDARVLTLFRDSRGLVWVGTEGGGLNRIDPSSDSVRLYTTEDGLPHDHVEGILEDRAGYLWISTNNGLARLDVVENRFLTFREAAGLAGNRFFANATYRGVDDRLYFGGEKGLTVIDPDLPPLERGPPVVALTGFRIQGNPAPLARALQETGLDLEHDENFFAFEFTSVDLLGEDRRRYRYRLDPLDETWMEAGPSPVANYTTVPPDDYTFRVEARTSDGPWEESMPEIRVRVQAPYYETWWFRLGVLALALSIVAGIYRYRLEELNRRQELRLAIAGRLHDDIGADLSSIAMKADLIRRSDRDEQSNRWLEELGDAARESASRVRETVWVVNTRYDKLPQLVEKVRDEADSMLLGLIPFGLVVTPDPMPDRRLAWEVRQDLYLGFKEAVSNAAKYSAATRIDIAIILDGPDLTIRIADDGVGFDTESVHRGNGLGLMQERMTRRGRVFSLWSAAGEGTVVTFGARLK